MLNEVSQIVSSFWDSSVVCVRAVTDAATHVWRRASMSSGSSRMMLFIRLATLPPPLPPTHTHTPGKSVMGVRGGAQPGDGGGMEVPVAAKVAGEG